MEKIRNERKQGRTNWLIESAAPFQNGNTDRRTKSHKESYFIFKVYDDKIDTLQLILNSKLLHKMGHYFLDTQYIETVVQGNEQLP